MVIHPFPSPPPNQFYFHQGLVVRRCALKGRYISGPLGVGVREDVCLSVTDSSSSYDAEACFTGWTTDGGSGK